MWSAIVYLGGGPYWGTCGLARRFVTPAFAIRIELGLACPPSDTGSDGLLVCMLARRQVLNTQV